MFNGSITGGRLLPATGLAAIGPSRLKAFQTVVVQIPPPDAPPDTFQPVTPINPRDGFTPDPLFDFVLRLPGRIQQYALDQLRGVQDVPPPGKPGSIVGEEILKAVLGEGVVRPFKILNNSAGGTLDPTGRSELPREYLDLRRKFQAADLKRFTDDALVKLIFISGNRPNLNPNALAIRRAALLELESRIAQRQRDLVAQQIAANATAGFIIGADLPAVPVVGGAGQRAKQAYDALDQAGALGQLAATIVFPGWKSDP